MISDSSWAASAPATSRPDIRPSLDAESGGQTLRKEDNAFLALSSGQISLPCEICQSDAALCQAAEKTLKQHSWVSSPLQVRPLLMFKSGIRVDVALLATVARAPIRAGRLTETSSSDCRQSSISGRAR